MHRVSMSRGRGGRVIKVRESLTFDGSSHDAFEGPDRVSVFVRDQCERVTGAMSAACATDPMDVGIGGVGHVVVDHVRDTLDIETAGCDVGGDHNVEVSLFETLQGMLALSLGSVAVQARDAMTRVGDLPRYLVGPMFGAGKDQD